MDIYQLITDCISSLPTLSEWPEVRSLLNHAASLRPRDWQLPLIACQAVGGSTEQAIPASAALACIQIGVILIDDMLDDDPRGEYRRLGEAQTANFAAAFISAGLGVILRSDIPPGTKLAATMNLDQVIVAVAFGQHLDCQNPADEKAYWRVVENKSSPFFGSAFRLGALFGCASGTVSGAMEQIGCLYGEMIQIHDDLNDTLTSPANPDWTGGRSPLPILFARLVDHPDQSRFLHLSENIHIPGNLEEAQDILIRSGAVSYCVHQLLRRHQAARSILDSISLARRELLDGLLEEVIAPVQKLFRAIDEFPPTTEPAHPG